MISLSTVEVNRSGKVITVSSPTISLLNDLLPEIGGNITKHYDDATNELINSRLNDIFNSNYSNEFTISINNFPLQCSAHHYLDDRAFLYFKIIEEKTSEKLQDIIDKKNEASRLKLLDFPFQNSSVPILYVYRDGSLYDFNEAFCKLFGYSVDDAKTFNLSNWNIGYLPDTWEQTWEKLKTEGVFSFVSKRSKKDGTVIDVEIRAHYIKFGDLELNCASITDITKQKKEEAKLKLADFSFKNVFSPIAFINEDGSFFYFNEATANLFGYTMEEFEKLKIFDIATTFNQEQWQERWNDVSQNLQLTLFSRLQKKDGSGIDAEIRNNRTNFGDVELNCSFYTDNTEINHLQMKLQMVEFSFIHSETAIVYMQEDGQFVDFNEAFVKLLGFSKEELIHADIFKLNPFFNPIMWQENWNELKVKGNLVYYTYRTKKDGSKIYLEINAKMMPYDGKQICCAYIRDITEEKKIDERLKLLEKVVTETNQSVVIADATEGMDNPIIYANDAFTTITDYSLEEVKGMNPRFLHKGMDVSDDAGRKIIRSALKNFVPWRVEIINTKKNGENYWADVAGFPVFDNTTGEYSHWVAIQTDITNRKKEELEKEQMIRELTANNKELKQFSYITSHNLRAPLTNLLSICNLINPEKITDSLTLKLIEGFKSSTLHLNETLNDLIKILIIKDNINFLKDCLDFQVILNKVKAFLSIQLMKEKVLIEADFSEAPTVNFTNVYLESIFQNLITNSIKYHHPERNPIIRIKTTKIADGSTQLTFTDNGLGMNMRMVKDKIFGLYQRFHSNSDGKGIGLYLLHSQITALGGKIEVESEEEVGTTFSITFI